MSNPQERAETSSSLNPQTPKAPMKSDNLPLENGRLIQADIYLSSQEIGSGSFAKVYLGKRLSSGEELAIKVVERARLNKKIMDALESEIRILRAMEHPHIVRLDDIIVRTFLCGRQI